MYPYVVQAYYKGGSVVTTQERRIHTAFPGEAPVVLQLRVAQEQEPFAQMDAGGRAHFTRGEDIVQVELTPEHKRRLVRLAHFIQCAVELAPGGETARVTAQAIVWELLDDQKVPYRIGLFAAPLDGRAVPMVMDADGVRVLPGYEGLVRAD